MKNNLFIMAGNGPYTNRGCEAIIRGSVKIINNEFKESKYIVSTVFSNDNDLNAQKLKEYDKNIIHTKINVSDKKYDIYWFIEKMRKYYNKTGEKIVFGQLNEYIKYSTAVLSVGGDNYSLDYGIPRLFVALDDYVIKRKIPLIIWGASVGPFNSNIDYEKFILNHLKKIDGIFVRESASYEYLIGKGIKSNVYRVADPAFLMDIEKVDNFKFDISLNDSIGINLSPLFANFLFNGNMKKWVEYAAKIVDSIIEKFKRPVVLIPHVGSKSENWDDFSFLKDVYEICNKDKSLIKLVSNDYNAAQMKWIISKLYIFAGARTHSTIAAFSTGIPTLSFSYSLKSKGINKDIYDCYDYCLNPKEIKINNILEKFEMIIERHSYLKEKINSALPNIKKEAMIAGKYLKDIIDK
jgi:polysaccharide pyruvyl transferase WcaK-like protein